MPDGQKKLKRGAIPTLFDLRKTNALPSKGQESIPHQSGGKKVVDNVSQVCVLSSECFGMI